MSDIRVLIDKIKKGDQLAWAELDNKYREKLTNFCRKWFSKTEDCEEAVQEIFLICYNKIDQLKNVDTFESWLYTVARNKCNELSNKKSRTVKTVTIYGDEDEVNSAVANRADDSPDANIEENYENIEQLKILMSILDMIPLEQRIVFEQRVFQDLPFKKIAELNGILETTAKARFKYAKNAIKKNIEAYEKKNNCRLHKGLFIIPVPLYRKAICKRGLSIFIIGGSTATHIGIIAGVSSAVVATAVAVSLVVLPNINKRLEDGKANNQPLATEVITDAQGNTEYITVPATEIVTDAQGNTQFVTAPSTEVVTDAQGNTHYVTQSSTSIVSTTPGTPPHTTAQTTTAQEPTESEKPFVPHEYEDENFAYYIYSKDNATVTMLKNTTANSIAIPDYIDGATVTELGADLFNNKSIKSISLPGTIKRIDERCFYLCSYLEALKLPYGLEEIGEEAFRYCVNLTEINIPQSVSVLGKSCLANTGVSSVAVPQNIKEIPDGMFIHCSNLTTVSFVNDLVKIGNGAFYDTSLENIKLPNTLKIIGDDAFGCIYNTNFKTISIPEGVETIGKSAFASSYFKEVFISGSVKGNLGERLFENCKYLEKVVFAEGVSRIPDYSFNLCTSLKSIYLPNSATDFNLNTFKYQKKPDNQIVYCKANSYAESFLHVNGITTQRY